MLEIISRTFSSRSSLRSRFVFPQSRRSDGVFGEPRSNTIVTGLIQVGPFYVMSQGGPSGGGGTPLMEAPRARRMSVGGPLASLKMDPRDPVRTKSEDSCSHGSLPWLGISRHLCKTRQRSRCSSFHLILVPSPALEFHSRLRTPVYFMDVAFKAC